MNKCNYEYIVNRITWEEGLVELFNNNNNNCFPQWQINNFYTKQVCTEISFTSVPFQLFFSRRSEEGGGLRGTYPLPQIYCALQYFGYTDRLLNATLPLKVWMHITYKFDLVYEFTKYKNCTVIAYADVQSRL